ncbi:MAG TPA: CoA transferase [Acidimicrobiales bacterium]|nr:CoA transferase [Acidimicrobiales bacterium]
MTQVMQGVRILEVAEQTFVPAASALLADLGAEVIKVEHVERGDAMRGLGSSGIAAIGGGGVHVLLEHSNRGKQSIGLDLATPEGAEILYKLAATCDVFLTNKLGNVRRKLKIDVEDIRVHNPNIIYCRGSGQGERGPDADKGAYDSLAFWSRAAVAASIMRQGDEHVPSPPGPGFGDSIGAMTIAGGIMGALFHRERTGEATVVDISLLASGLWAMGQTISLSLQLDMPWSMPPGDVGINPLTGNYRVKDGWLMLTCLQAAKYWPSAAQVIGQPELATDARFADHESLMANSKEAVAILKEAFAQHTVEEWRERLEHFTGQWAVVQNTIEAANDVQSQANGYLQDSTAASGTTFRLVTVPVQYDETPAPIGRAPEFNEHGDQILESLGYDWDTVVDLKVKGVVA